MDLNGDYGVLNYLLSLIGIEGPKWLVDPAWALMAVIIASAFGVGSMMLIFYTDIKNIPIDLYEAANLMVHHRQDSFSVLHCRSSHRRFCLT